MTVPNINKSYLISFGNLSFTPSFYANHLEPMVTGVYLMVPPLQASFDPAIFGTIGQFLSAGSPVLVALFGWLVYKGELMSRAAAERLLTKEVEERAKAEEKAEKAHAKEVESLKAAHERDRVQYETRIEVERTAKEMWHEAWAKTQALAVQQKVP